MLFQFDEDVLLSTISAEDGDKSAELNLKIVGVMGIDEGKVFLF